MRDPTLYFWRTGRSVHRTIYVLWPDGSEQLIGMMDTADLAESAVETHNDRITVTSRIDPP